jgi:UDP-N-acetylmuramoyl-L-alanyl-D-glutamate--2,6-diaminopimelate ligase
LADVLRWVNPREHVGPLDSVFEDVQCRLFKVRRGDLFAAVVDHYRNGHALIDAAIEKGAGGVLLSERPGGTLPVPWVRVEDVGAALGRLCAEWYGRPSEKLDLIGVTGTNGKTTTVHILESILRAAGRRPGRIGTLGFSFAGTSREAEVLSTPEPPVLQRELDRMQSGGATAVAMEVTSQGISMGRVRECAFSVRALTGITPDHLDYHGTFRRYAETKMGWIRRVRSDPIPRIVLPLDHARTSGIRYEGIDCVHTFGMTHAADVHPDQAVLGSAGIAGSVTTPLGDVSFESKLVGRHNLQNILAAVAISVALELPLEAISEGIAGCESVPGRLERIANGSGAAVFVDFAHTPDALRAALAAVRQSACGRVVVVFGCGGDRDPEKRPVMARLASEAADTVVLTSDNPRNESVQGILDDMISGVPEGLGYKVQVVPDRREAIELALRAGGPGDVVLVAGRGPERHQVAGDREIDFDDREVVRELLRRGR